jgi:hypothetical protein
MKLGCKRPHFTAIKKVVNDIRRCMKNANLRGKIAKKNYLKRVWLIRYHWERCRDCTGVEVVCGENRARILKSFQMTVGLKV